MFIHIVIKEIVNSYAMNFPEKLCVITEQTSKTNSSKNTWKPLVLIIPLRLGISTINPAYVQGVKVSSSILFLSSVCITLT